MDFNDYEFFQNFIERDDLTKYTDNALLLYSLQIRFGIEDIDEVASTSLTDGGGDKKADLVYIDTDKKEAIIAQGYYASKFKAEAPANKASDLNTAITWLLARDLKDVPERLKSAASELRQKINDREITKISLWYSHNSPESENVQQELKSAEATLSSTLKNHFQDKEIECSYLEIGLSTLNTWYSSLTIPILVTDKIEVDDCMGFQTEGPDWESFTTSFPADKLWELYKSHSTLLFSANVRDYLGSRKSDSNINNGIKASASVNPKQFFVYNNGITALTNKFELDGKKLTVSGISIVNGAQTTGAIGSLAVKPDSNLKYRFDSLNAVILKPLLRL
ncbi:AIPR family protein [Flavobacterium sp. ZS1P14]|uniref:AIPR family protein n=1 Tax=Flavobacterium sp. ZS1P14 TaxID=3401729 RepID=UPI003AAE3270